MGKLKLGMQIPSLDLKTIKGKNLKIPSPEIQALHIQFRRFAGCPICNLHLRSFMKR